MSIIRPFRGLRPLLDKVELVASPPYDVIDSNEARVMAEGNPYSFLRVIKPEIELAPETDIYSDEVYQRGLDNLNRFVSEGILVRDPSPLLYLYEQSMMINGKIHSQLGVMAGVSVDEYQSGKIKKHEFTRADKEADRTRHVDKLNANTGPIFLTYRASEELDGYIERCSKKDPAYDFVAKDGISHRLWILDKQEEIEFITEGFLKLPCLYIADGHHRSASASAVREKRKAQNPNHNGNEEYNFFMAVIFPHNRLHIMDYNRIVSDLAGLTEEEFKSKIEEKFDIIPSAIAKPSKPLEFGMYLNQKWYRLTSKPGSYDVKDPVESLDVSILQNNLLSPILKIHDPRKDTRIDFVGGIRGIEELERRVNAKGSGVAFSMFPTSIEQLMEIADANQVMPPKSTWFEPKLRSGMVVRLLD